MTREETLAIMSVLKAAYPPFYKDMKWSEAEAIVELWATMFADDPVAVVAAAVKAHIATDKKGFPPHIGAIKEAVVKVTQPEEMTEAEAWGRVIRSVSNSIYGSQKEFDALPPVLQRLVGSPNQLKEWAMMDADTVSSVVASNFQRSYRARASHEREMLALPSDVRQTMAQLGGGKSMLQLGDGGGDRDEGEEGRVLLRD
jgi:hypothetical protein